MDRSPLTLADRWRTVRERRRGCLYHVLADVIYLISGFHL